MCSAYVWPRSVDNLKLNIDWLYFMSALYLLNPWWDLQITLHKCQVWWDDVQCLCLTKVGSRSRSEFKIKHCMTVFHVGSISFEPLVGFTNYFPEMSSMMRRCAVPMFDKGQCKKSTIFSMLHMGYSSPSVIALVYDFTFLYKKIPSSDIRGETWLLSFLKAPVKFIISWLNYFTPVNCTTWIKVGLIGRQVKR